MQNFGWLESKYGNNGNRFPEGNNHVACMTRGREENGDYMLEMWDKRPLLKHM